MYLQRIYRRQVRDLARSQHRRMARAGAPSMAYGRVVRAVPSITHLVGRWRGTWDQVDWSRIRDGYDLMLDRYWLVAVARSRAGFVQRPQRRRDDVRHPCEGACASLFSVHVLSSHCFSSLPQNTLSFAIVSRSRSSYRGLSMLTCIRMQG